MCQIQPQVHIPIVGSLRDDDDAEDSRQHWESQHVEKEQDNGYESAAALPRSFDPEQGEVSGNDRYGPHERTKQGEYYRDYHQPVRLSWRSGPRRSGPRRSVSPLRSVRRLWFGIRNCGGLWRAPTGFVSGAALSFVEKHVTRADDLIECLRVATGIGMATAPRHPVKRPQNLLPVSAFRHTENVVRIASDLPIDGTAHCPASFPAPSLAGSVGA
jgi:hypothetical protein